jgi:inner membrane protein
MDSLSQIVLGAAVSACCAPPAYRRPALILGAIVGTLPDLDVLIPQPNAVEEMIDHRSWTHSLLVLPWIGLFLSGLLASFWPQARMHFWRWLLAIELALVTHPILDAFTVYGTQLFWPLPYPPVMWGSVFIIDPLYTVPLIIATTVAWRSHNTLSVRRWLHVGLLFSSSYLIWGISVQNWVTHQVTDQLSKTDPHLKILVAPAPFTTLLWRIVVMTSNEHYLEGYYSVLAPKQTISFKAYPSGHEYKQQLYDNVHYKKLKWFSHDFYSIREHEQKLVFADLRMGSEPSYPFQFALAERCDEKFCAIDPKRLGWPAYQSKDWLRWWRMLRGD